MNTGCSRTPFEGWEQMHPYFQTDCDITVPEWESGEFDRFQTTIWFMSAHGSQVAQRIARDLEETGVTLLYPGERDVLVMVGERHRIIEIGETIPEDER